MTTAPNGDVFLAESHAGDIKVFRGIGADGKPKQTETFVTGLKQPYGIAFYPPGANPRYIYIGDTDAILRIAYNSGDLKASGTSREDCGRSGRRRPLDTRPGVFARWQAAVRGSRVGFKSRRSRYSS